MSSGVWQVLGVSPDCSEAELRRAYAVKLRVTNPEDDPDGFKRLRSAYEDALQFVKHRTSGNPNIRFAFDDDDEGDDEAFDSPDSAPVSFQVLSDPEPIAPPPPPLEQDRDSAWSDQVMACFQLEQLINNEGDPQDVHAFYESIIWSEAMDRVDIHAMVEDRLAGMFMRTYPKSRVIIERAISDFRWEEEFRQGAHNIRAQLVEFWKEAQVSERDRAKNLLAEQARRDYEASELIADTDAAKKFLNRVLDRRHEFFPALRDLERPAPKDSVLTTIRNFGKIPIMDRFLTHLDLNHPQALQFIPPDSVRWWRLYISKYRQTAKFINVTLYCAFIFTIGFLAFALSQTPAKPQFVARAACEKSLAVTFKGEAMVDCAQAASDQPGSIMANTYAGIAYLQANALDNAVASFDKVLAVSPLDPMALYGGGVAQSRRGDANSKAAGSRDMQTAMALWPYVSQKFKDFGVDQVEQPQIGVEKPVVHPPIKAPADGPPTWRSEGFSEEDLKAATASSGVSSVPQSGFVVLRCYLGSEGGNPRICEVAEESTPFSGLADVAIALMTAESSHMDPATSQGVPINNYPVSIRIDFQERKRELEP